MYSNDDEVLARASAQGPAYLPSYETYAQMLRAMKLEQMKRCTQQGRHQEAGALWTELFNDN